MQIFFDSGSPGRRRIQIKIWVALLSLSSYLSARAAGLPPNPYQEPQVYAEIIRIRDLILAGDYQPARTRCDALEKAHPDLLVPPLGRMLSLMAQMFEQDQFLHETRVKAEFFSLEDLYRSISFSRGLVYEDFLFLGGAYGGLGLHVSRHDDYLEAFRLGLIGLYYISRGHELDPKPSDDQLAWGIFHYYRGYLAQSLPWLPFYEDDMKQGLAEIRNSQAGLYSGPIATLALIYVLGRGPEPERALPYSTQLLRQFPNSPLIAIEHGRALLHNGRYPEAAALFQGLRLTIPQNNKILYYLGWAQTYGAEMKGLENPGALRRAAEDCLNAFLASKPDPIYSSYAQLLLGDLDRQAKNLARAKAHYQISLQLNPKYDAARQRLNSLP